MSGLCAALLALGLGWTASTVWAQPPELPQLTWRLLPTNTTAQFRGLSAVSRDVAWVSGSRGTVLRTLDGGATWSRVGPALAGNDTTLEFRDVEALSADGSRAVVLSIGEGAASRIYATQDGGAAWSLAFQNAEEAAFYNCLAFTGPEKGFALSDPVGGRFRLVQTSDGGRSWSVVDQTGMPPAQPGEYAFSASGQCLTASPSGTALYAGAGGVLGPGRIFRNPTGDGLAWSAADTSIPGSEGGGVFSVQFRKGDRLGIALGGDYLRPNASAGTSAYSVDGGASWLPSATFPGGYRSGSSWLPGACGVAVAVGPSGSDITLDGGRNWRAFDNGSFDTVQCLAGGVCWASGQGGRVARLSLEGIVGG